MLDEDVLVLKNLLTLASNEILKRDIRLYKLEEAIKEWANSLDLKGAKGIAAGSVQKCVGPNSKYGEATVKLAEALLEVWN